jgi:2-C-methyl-D-erythritol 4-phosphate cytidylyltransferase
MSHSLLPDAHSHSHTHPYADTGVVLVAGGGGIRFGGNKLLVHLDGMPVFLHSLQTFARLVPADHMVLVVAAAARREFEIALGDFPYAAGIQLVNGGGTRQESVHNGLKALAKEVAFAAVHDAARPFVAPELISACIDSARATGSGVAAHRVTDTIKVVDDQNRVVATPDRQTLCATETPQIFRRDELLAAYDMIANRRLAVTDEAAAMELAGHRVCLVIHDRNNRKITYPHDLA